MLAAQHRGGSSLQPDHRGVPKGLPKARDPHLDPSKPMKKVAATKDLFFLAFVSVAPFQPCPKREPKAFELLAASTMQ